MSYIFIEERSGGTAEQVAAGPVMGVQSSGPCNVREPLAQVVGEARHAVQIATKEAAAGAAQDTTITPVMTGTYVQSREAADSSVEYVSVRN